MPPSFATFGPLRVTPGERYRDETEVTLELGDEAPHTTHFIVAHHVLEATAQAATALTLEYQEAREGHGEHWAASPLKGAKVELTRTASGVEVIAPELTDQQRQLIAKDWAELGTPEHLRVAVANRRFESRADASSVADAVGAMLTRGIDGGPAHFTARLHHLYGGAATFELSGTQRQLLGPDRSIHFLFHGSVSVRLGDAQLVEVRLEGPGALFEGDQKVGMALKSLSFRRAT